MISYRPCAPISWPLDRVGLNTYCVPHSGHRPSVRPGWPPLPRPTGRSHSPQTRLASGTSSAGRRRAAELRGTGGRSSIQPPPTVPTVGVAEGLVTVRVTVRPPRRVGTGAGRLATGDDPEAGAGGLGRGDGPEAGVGGVGGLGSGDGLEAGVGAGGLGSAGAGAVCGSAIGDLCPH